MRDAEVETHEQRPLGLDVWLLVWRSSVQRQQRRSRVQWAVAACSGLRWAGSALLLATSWQDGAGPLRVWWVGFAVGRGDGSEPAVGRSKKDTQPNKKK